MDSSSHVSKRSALSSSGVIPEHWRSRARISIPVPPSGVRTLVQPKPESGTRLGFLVLARFGVPVRGGQRVDDVVWLELDTLAERDRCAFESRLVVQRADVAGVGVA